MKSGALWGESTVSHGTDWASEQPAPGTNGCDCVKGLTVPAVGADDRLVPAYADSLTSMVRVVWIDKGTGENGVKVFSFVQPALGEAEWLRSQGHLDVQVFQRGHRLN
jgi:hypothetical protein